MMMGEQRKDNRPYWKVIVSLAFSLVGTVAIIWLGVQGVVYFMPFVIGWFISFIASPFVSWLERRLKMKKNLGSAIIIVIVLVVIIWLMYLVGGLLIRELRVFISHVPELYKDLEQDLRLAGGRMSGAFDMLPTSIQKGWTAFVNDLDSKAGVLLADLSQPTVIAAGNIARSIPSLLVATIVTLVSAYFFIAQRDEIIVWSKTVAPGPVQRRMTLVIDNLKRAVGGYIQAQCKIMLIVGILLAIGFWILQLRYAIVLAILIGFLDFLPFFGTGTVLVPWAVYEIMIGEYQRAIGLVLIYVITQLARHLLQPKLLGDSMGMKPLPTLILIFAGYRFGGFIGLILALPLGVIVMNLHKAGAFDYILDDVKVLISGILSLRNRNETDVNNHKIDKNSDGTDTNSKTLEKK